MSYICRFICAWCGSTYEMAEEDVKVFDVGENGYCVKVACPRCMQKTILEDVGV